MRSRSASSELFATCKRQEGQRNRRVKEESYRKKSTGPSSRHINRQNCSYLMIDTAEKTSSNQHIVITNLARSDFLASFESGQFHDCTIRANGNLENSEPDFKDFKCHKLILGASSVVFESMFSSLFVQMGPDQPILLDKVQPAVFETAMKFIYGNVAEFKNFKFAIEIFEFAHKMNIKSLMKALDNYFEDLPEAVSDICAIFDSYLEVGNQLGIQICKKHIQKETIEALKSEDWSKMRLESVKEVLGMEFLNCDEAEVVKAVVRWGESQQGREILPCLPLIRFAGLSATQFAHLSQRELHFVLTLQEKHSILLALVTGDWISMPSFVGLNLKKRSRDVQVITFTSSSSSSSSSEE